MPIVYVYIYIYIYIVMKASNIKHYCYHYYYLIFTYMHYICFCIMWGVMWIFMCDCECVEMDAVELTTWWAFIRTMCALVPVIYICWYMIYDIWYDYEIHDRAAQDEIFFVVMDLFIDIWTIKYDRSIGELRSWSLLV